MVVKPNQVYRYNDTVNEAFRESGRKFVIAVRQKDPRAEDLWEFIVLEDPRGKEAENTPLFYSKAQINNLFKLDTLETFKRMVEIEKYAM